MSGAQENPILPAAKPCRERPPLQYLEKRHSNTFFQICRAAGLTCCRKLPASAFSLYYSGFALPASIPLRRIASKNGKMPKNICQTYIILYMPSTFSYGTLPAIPFLPQIRSCIQCRFVLYYGMYTKQNLKEGVRRGDYTGKLRRKAADSQRLCPSVSGKGLQAHKPSPRFSRQQMCRQVPSRIFSTPKTACLLNLSSSCSATSSTSPAR